MERIGIIGDVHAEHQRLETALDLFEKKKVDLLLCTGDLADGRGDLDACCMLTDAGALVVAGNHDRWFLEEKVRHVADAHYRQHVSSRTVQFIESLPRTRSVDTGLGKLILCHGVLDDDLAKIWPGSENSGCRRSPELDSLLLEQSAPRFFINGHMHFRTVVDFTRTQMINAGTLKGQYAGFCMLDFTALTLSSFNFIDDAQAELVRTFDLLRTQWSQNLEQHRGIRRILGTGYASQVRSVEALSRNEPNDSWPIRLVQKRWRRV